MHGGAGDVLGRVELARLERGDHRVGVVEHAEHDLVDRRPAAPVVRVGLEARELALLELLEHERAGADAVLGVVACALVCSNLPQMCFGRM